MRSFSSLLCSSSVFFAACGGAHQASSVEGDPAREADAGCSASFADGGAAAGTPDAAVDACDKEFRAYGEAGNYMDVHVGAMPKVTLTSPQDAYVVSQGESVGSSIAVSSLDGCGSVELLGVDVVIRRTDGAHFPFVSGAGPSNRLQLTGMPDTWDSATFWSGNSQDLTTAYLLWVAWDKTGPSIKSGPFDRMMVGADDTVRFDLELPVIAVLPVGEYRLIHAVHWKDPETGTEVWYADFDGAIQTVAVQ